MGVEREKGMGMEELIDEIWMSFLDKLKKKEVSMVRSKFGDEVNLFVPQMRLLLPMCANPRFPKSLYDSSYQGAKRNAYAIMRKLDMPPDFYWKFESWADKRAFELLSKVTNRIFREIMKTNKEGLLSVVIDSTDPEGIKIILTLDECVECSGIAAKHPICFYHAGTLTGIISALLGEELDGCETECCANGGEKCVFLIGKKGRVEGFEEYLNPGKIDFSLDKRLEIALDKNTILRELGNEVDLRYYQLVILNSLITNPKVFSASSHEVGVEYGEKLASFLEKHYNKKGEDLFGDISKYFGFEFLKQLQIKIEKGAGEIRAAEVAEISGLTKNEDVLKFLFGELEGILSVITNEKMVYRRNTFEDDTLVIKFEMQE
ncbi:MAG: V4R domain-containing protein [Halobacteriota archaeon]